MTREQAEAIGRSPRPVGLLGAVVATGEAIRLRDLNVHEAFGGFPEHHAAMKSFLGVPVRFRGASRGNLYLANKRGADEFTDDDQDAVRMLADRVAIALEIGHLRELEQREHARLELLAKAGPALAESLDYDATLQAIGAMVVPSIAEMCTLDLVDEGGASRRVLVRHADPDKQRLLEELGMIANPRQEGPKPCEPHVVSDITDAFLEQAIPDPVHREIIRKVGLRCSVSVPLFLRGQAIGVLHVATGDSRERLGDKVPVIVDAARLAAFVIENARLYKSAQSAISARERVLRIIAHDLRNPLWAIRLQGERLRLGGPALEGRSSKAAQVIAGAVGRMERLIGDILDVTRLEAGKLTLERQSLHPAQLIADVVDTQRAITEAESIELVSDEVGAGLPDIWADRERLLQVFDNLVSNAVKFTPRGGRITIGVARDDIDTVRFWVKDTGAGIAAEQVPHMFEEFWQAAETDRRGAGLGLAIVKGIIDAHGGRISVESDVGVGTTFVLALPVSRPTPTQPDEATAEARL